MADTPINAAPEWAQAQASPWLTVNRALRTLEAMARAGIVQSRALATPPGSCADGDCYLVDATATGAWVGKEDYVAVAVGANASNGWYFIPVAKEGVQLYVVDENKTVYWDGAAWSDWTGAGPATESFIIAVTDETSVIAAGTAKITLRMPYAFVVTEVRGSLNVAQTSGSTFTIDINEGPSSILSTKLTIDNGEKTSTTAATPAVISDANLADDAEVTIDIDTIGDGTAIGLKVIIIGHKP